MNMHDFACAVMPIVTLIAQVLLPAAYVLLWATLTVGSYAFWHAQTYGRLPGRR